MGYACLDQLDTSTEHKPIVLVRYFFLDSIIKGEIPVRDQETTLFLSGANLAAWQQLSCVFVWQPKNRNNKQQSTTKEHK